MNSRDIKMTQKTDRNILEQMSINREKMKQLKASYGTMLFMTTILIVIQLIFFFVGGLNVYMLEGIFLNIIVFYCGTKKFNNKFILYILIMINFLAAFGFWIWNPVSEMLLRLGIAQHLYLAVQLYMFIKLSEKKYELSCELGYPYFTQIAELQMDTDSEYIPESVPLEGVPDMETINHKDKTTQDLSVKKETNISNAAEMETLNYDSVPNKSFGDLIKNDYNPYTEMYNLQPQTYQEEVEYDKELMKINNRRMKIFKRSQEAFFFVDLIVAIALVLSFLGALTDIFDNPFMVFNILKLIGVAITSLITVTCLDNKLLIKNSIYAFATSGIFFAVILMDMSYISFFTAYIIQLLISLKLSDEHDYLKSQPGYPYFTAKNIRKQNSTHEYRPEHQINFKNNGMDEL